MKTIQSSWLLFLAALVILFGPPPANAQSRSTLVRYTGVQAGQPTAVAVSGDESRIYVAQAKGGRVLVLSTAGKELGRIEGMGQPIGIAVTGSNDLLIGDSTTGSVSVFDGDLRFRFKLGAGDAEFKQPTSIAVAEGGKIYVADAGGDVIKVYDAEGIKLFSFGVSGSGAGELNYPTAVAFDPETGELLVVDLPMTKEGGQFRQLHEGARVQVFDQEGGFLRSFGQFGLGDGSLVKPLGLAVANNGHIFLADAYQNVVQVFDRQGTFLGTVYDLTQPMRTPVDICVGLKTGRLFIGSVNTESIEIYGPALLHTVIASAGSGGAVSPAGSKSVGHGDSLHLTITPEQGFHTRDVLVDGSSVGPVAEYTFPDIIADHTLIAVFAADTHIILASGGAGGSVSPGGPVTVGDGQNQRFALVPDAGYHVDQIIVDGLPLRIGIGSEYTFFNVRAGHTLEVRFAIDSFVITTILGGRGSIAPAGGVAVASGADQTFAIAPAAGYQLTDVLVDDISIGPAGTYTFKDVKANHTLQAYFTGRVASYSLDVTVVGDGTVAGSPAGVNCPGTCSAEYEAETTVTLVAVPGPGSLFTGWAGACATSTAECVVSITGPTFAAAYFLPDEEMDTFEQGDFSKLPWRSGGAAAWEMTDRVQHSGAYAAQAPILAAGEMSFFEVPLDIAVAGEIGFWLKMAESGQVRFLIDGSERESWTGGQDWTAAAYGVAAGWHVFRWEYLKDSDGSADFGSAWLDDVSFPAHEAPVYPLPDIKVSSVDGPVEAQRGWPVSLTIALAAGDRIGVAADWWIAVDSPWGWYFYSMDMAAWQAGQTVAHQGGIEDIFSHAEILHATDLPAGRYTVYFGVDTSANNVLDSPLVYDSVEVNILE